MGLPISTVNVSLGTATTSRAGFGTLLFVSSHKKFTARVNTYRNLQGLLEDFRDDEPTYIAISKALSQIPAASTVKVGRRDCDVLVTVDAVEIGNSYGFIVGDSDNLFEVSYVAQGADTASDVAGQLKTLLDSAGVIGKFTSAVSGSVITITNVAGEDYIIRKPTNVEIDMIPVGTAATAMAAIDDEDSDYYFITAEDHSDAFVINMSDYVSTQEKLYFTSSDDVLSLSTLTDVSTDLLAKLTQANYLRTAGAWHQDADTNFIECGYVGFNAVYAPDERAVVWDGLELATFETSKQANGRQIKASQQMALDQRNASYIIRTLAGDRILGGKTANGTWIDELHIRDCMVARVRESMNTLLMNQRGGKVNAGDVGLALIENALSSALQPFVAADAISKYEVDMSHATIDFATRTLNDVRFTATLSGAIIRVVINGTLTNDEG